MRYLTPACLRVLGTGLPLDDVPDSDIAGWIDEAEGQIDSWMNFDERNSLGFATGPRDERQFWDPATRRINPTCYPTPVQTVTFMEIIVSQQLSTGNPVHAVVPVNAIIINNDYKYLESVDLAVALYSLAPILSSLGMMQPFVHIQYVAGYSILKTARRLYMAPTTPYDPLGTNPPDAATDFAWHSRVPFWDIAQPVVITQNGTPLLANQYTVNAEDGCITFAAGVTILATDVIRATFNHQIPDVPTQVCKGIVTFLAGEYMARASGMAGFEQLKGGVRMAKRFNRESAIDGELRKLSGLKDPVVLGSLP